MRSTRDSAGFTVPELIVAIVILFVLLLASGLILRSKSNPNETYAAQQKLNMAATLQALSRYEAAAGKLPDGITNKPTFIGSQEDQLDLCSQLVPVFIQDLPIDPMFGGKAYRPEAEDTVSEKHLLPCNEADMVYMTGYALFFNKDGKLVIATLDGQQNIATSITR